MAKTVVEEIPLPSYTCNIGSNPFVFANQLGKRGLSIDTFERVQMIRHKQEQVQIPPRSFMGKCALCSLALQPSYHCKVVSIYAADSKW